MDYLDYCGGVDLCEKRRRVEELFQRNYRNLATKVEFSLPIRSDFDSPDELYFNIYFYFRDIAEYIQNRPKIIKEKRSEDRNAWFKSRELFFILENQIIGKIK